MTPSVTAVVERLRGELAAAGEDARQVLERVEREIAAVAFPEDRAAVAYELRADVRRVEQLAHAIAWDRRWSRA